LRHIGDTQPPGIPRTVEAMEGLDVLEVAPAGSVRPCRLGRRQHQQRGPYGASDHGPPPSGGSGAASGAVAGATGRMSGIRNVQKARSIPSGSGCTSAMTRSGASSSSSRRLIRWVSLLIAQTTKEITVT